jgi:hypothetical protein
MAPLVSKGTQRKGVIGRLPHLGNRRRKHFRQALTAPLRLAGQRRPATFGEQLVGLLEAGRHGHRLVVPLGAFEVTRNVERRQHFLGKLGGLFENRVNEIGRRLFATG